MGLVQARLIAISRKADDLARIAAAGLGMAAPVALGAALGHPAEGLAASVGGLMVGGIAPGRDARGQAREIGATLVPVAAALAVAVAVAGSGALEAAVVVAVAFGVSLAGSFSRPMAVGAVRFVLLLLIAVALADSATDRAGLAFIVSAGAAWTAAANLLAGAVARRWRAAPPPPVAEASPATFAQRLARWRKSLRSLEGWQYALRLGAGLAVAAAIGARWPGHHLYWISFTVALLTERTPEPWPAKTAQRALGTLAGVIAAGVLFAEPLPAWALAIAIGALGAARPWLRERSYAAYTAVTTPLILAILDGGEPPGIGLLADRLVATVAGALLVLAGNRVFRRR